MRKIRRPKKNQTEVIIPDVRPQGLRINAFRKNLNGEIIWRDELVCGHCRKYPICIMDMNHCFFATVAGKCLRDTKIVYRTTGPVLQIPVKDLDTVKDIISKLKKSFVNTNTK